MTGEKIPCHFYVYDVIILQRPAVQMYRNHSVLHRLEFHFCRKDKSLLSVQQVLLVSDQDESAY